MTKPCRKRRFRSHDQAIIGIRLIRNHSDRDRIPARAYYCDECNGWHLTSQSHNDFRDIPKDTNANDVDANNINHSRKANQSSNKNRGRDAA